MLDQGAVYPDGGRRWPAPGHRPDAPLADGSTDGCRGTIARRVPSIDPHQSATKFRAVCDQTILFGSSDMSPAIA